VEIDCKIKQFLDYDEYNVETKSFNYSSYFMDWNQQLKYNEDDAEWEDLDAKFLVGDVSKKRAKLDVVREVILMKRITNDVPYMCLSRILELIRLKLIFLYFK